MKVRRIPSRSAGPFSIPPRVGWEPNYRPLNGARPPDSSHALTHDEMQQEDIDLGVLERRAPAVDTFIGPNRRRRTPVHQN